MIKVTRALLLTAFMAVLLTGCASGTGAPGTDSAPGTGTASATEVSSGTEAVRKTEAERGTEAAGETRPVIVIGTDDAGESGPETRAAIRIDAAEEMTEAETLPEETIPEETEPVDNTIRLAFAGDIYLSDHVLSAYDRAGHVSGILDGTLLDACRGADLFIANEEFPFGTGGTPAPDKQFTFRVDPRRCAIFNELGIDLVTLANNHSLDYGRSALEETFETLDRFGIPYIGAGKDLERAKAPKIFEIKGKKIAFLSASRVIPVSSWAAGSSSPGVFTTYDPAQLVKAIRAADEQCDVTVVYVHWGIERNTQPEAYQKDLALQYIRAGADLVIGAHPHVLQPIRYLEGVPVAYSLGNFLFGSSIPSTELLLADIAEDGSIALSVIPAKGSGGYTRATGGAEAVGSGGRE